ncbi:MAG: CHAD domain-containing protein [bacterium]
MTDSIEPGEPAAGAIRRLARAHLDDAIAAAGDEDRDAAVHDVRKALKKTRAILRLARGALGEAVYQRENVACRDVARRVAEARDAKARIETLDRVRETFEGPLDDKPFPAVRAAFEAAHGAALAALDEGEVLAGVADALRVVRARVDEWPIEGEGFAVVSAGFCKVYRRGFAGRRAVEERPRAKVFHEWRKRAKYLRYQLDALASLWPPVFEVWEAELHALTDLLGEAHDLVVLDEALDALDAVALAERLALRGLADARRRRLEGEARALGAKLYADRPAVVVARVGRFWDVAQRQ